MERVTIYVLFGKYKDSYPGEHAPNAIDSIDEFTLDDLNDENWMDEKLKKVKAEWPDYESLRWIPIEVDYTKIRELVESVPPAVEGKVLEPTE